MKATSVPVGIQESIRESLSHADLPLKCSINFWDQAQISVGNDHATLPPLTLNIRHPGVLRALVLRQNPLVLADAYLGGFIDFSGSIESLIVAFRRLSHVNLSLDHKLWAWIEALTLLPLPSDLGQNVQQRQVAQSPDHDRNAIQYHYDVGNDFYRLWLDPHLVYTCAHYEHPHMSLADAQTAKLDLICRKLRLQPGETLLDVGCGWGALLRWAVKHYGVKGYGITLSEEQVAFGQKTIKEEGLGDRLQIELRDYRDLPQQPTFDKAVAIGIIEHVGRKNYPVFFNRILSLLKPGGLFLNHGITATQEANGKTIGERFIHRYFFPNGELVRISTILTAMEDAGWEIVDVDAWRIHYAMTLRHWVENFDREIDALNQRVGDRMAQLWRLYLVGSALAFENNNTGLYQVLLRRQADPQWNLPLTRSGWLC